MGFYFLCRKCLFLDTSASLVYISERKKLQIYSTIYSENWKLFKHWRCQCLCVFKTDIENIVFFKEVLWLYTYFGVSILFSDLVPVFCCLLLSLLNRHKRRPYKWTYLNLSIDRTTRSTFSISSKLCISSILSYCSQSRWVCHRAWLFVLNNIYISRILEHWHGFFLLDKL